MTRRQGFAVGAEAIPRVRVGQTARAQVRHGEIIEGRAVERKPADEVALVIIETEGVG
jgi:hypothetical protein